MTTESRQSEPLDVSVVIPVYNSASTIDELCDRLCAVLDEMRITYELVLVDDGSIDDSALRVTERARRDSHIQFLALMRNFGQHPAITAGLAASRGRWVVLMDDDLQNPPEEIPRLYEAAQEGFDVVYGIRQTRSDGWIRRAGARAADWLLRSLFSYSMRDTFSSFRILSRRVVAEYLKISENHTYVAALIAWMGFPCKSIVVRHDPRKEGRSQYRFSKLMSMWFDLGIGFSNRPLRIATVMGMIFSLLAFVLVGRSLIIYFFFAADPLLGYTSMFAAQMFFAGVILMFMGMIGEYLGRVYTEAKNRPQYILDDQRSVRHSQPDAERAVTDESSSAMLVSPTDG